ncbi:MAG: tape measure protein, partial [Dysgonamonadaceae bacterium]
MALKAFEVFGEVDLRGEEKVKRGLKGLVGEAGSFGDKFLAAAGVGIAAAGAAAVAGVGLVIKKGFDRALDIQDAKATLGALGYDLQQVQGIADDVVASVKGTPFALNDAMGAATSALAAGVKEGEELTSYLAAIGDAATVAKVPFGDMAQIFNKVTGVGKVTGDVIQQTGERGIPVLQWLADEYGVSAEAMRDMVSRGEVDAAMFQQAITSNIGGAALAAGDTVRGASDNMMAAMGRLGARFVEPLLEHIGGGLGKITEWIDGLGPIADNAGKLLSGIFGALKGDVAWDEILPPELVGIFETIGRVAAPVIDTLKDSFANFKEQAAPALESVKNAWEQLQPVVELVAGVIGAVLAVVLGVVIGVVNGIVNAIAPLAQAIGGIVAIVSGIVNLIVGIFTGDGEKINAAIDGIVQGIADVFGGLWGTVEGFITGFVDGVVGFFTGLWDTLVGHSIVPDIINDIVQWFIDLPGLAAGALSDFIAAVTTAMTDTAVAAVGAVDTMVADIIAALENSPIFGP